MARPMFCKTRRSRSRPPSTMRFLVKVRAASLNPADWRVLGGVPRLFRLLFRLCKPTVREPARLGHDLSGQIEAVGQGVTRFKPGDELFGVGPAALAECACTSEMKLGAKPQNLTFDQAASAPTGALTALAGPARQRTDSAGAKGFDQRGGGRHGHVSPCRWPARWGPRSPE
jgi:NADPH:quinone reductase-like Zn-dependent oxidoreductase